MAENSVRDDVWEASKKELLRSADFRLFLRRLEEEMQEYKDSCADIETDERTRLALCGQVKQIELLLDDFAISPT